MYHILIVEDETAISTMMQRSLISAGYYCEIAQDGMSAADRIEQKEYDLILLDIMLPHIDGYELLEYIKHKGPPVIFVSAKGQLEDKIKGLRMGADDYLVKPFQIGELMARVEAILRRVGKGHAQIIIDDVEINLESHTVLKNGSPIKLTNMEFRLLSQLVENKNVAIYRERLYENVWEEPYEGQTRTLDAHIQRVRKKLDWQDKIITIPRVGYRLEV